MIHRFKDVEKILVIKLRQIGDVVLTLPVFRALREHFREAHIAALVNSGTDEVLHENPFINEVIIFDRGIKNRANVSRVFRELRFLRDIRAKGFDMTVDLTNVDRTAILSFASGARYRLAHNSPQKGIPWKRYVYSHRASKNYEHHSVLKNLDVVREFGITTDTISLELPVHERDRDFVRKMFRAHNIDKHDRIIHIHPVSRLLFKCWKDEYMAEVIHWAVCRDIKVVITSSTETREFEKVKKIISLVLSRNNQLSKQGEAAKVGNLLDLSGRTTVGELAAVSEASSLFFGVDSAPMHIAASVGTQVIALFGKAEARWSPWGKGHRVFSGKLKRKNGESDESFVHQNLLQVKPQEIISELDKRLCLLSSTGKDNNR